MKRTKLFMDSEFSGLHQNTTLISIGLISEGGRTFYAEFTDYDKEQCDEWVNVNVISKLQFNDVPDFIKYCGPGKSIEMKGNKEDIKIMLGKWLDYVVLTEAKSDNNDFSGLLEIWSDCLSYDWVLFCELFGGAFGVPKEIYYIPFDLSTLFLTQGVDPDINREEFLGISGGEKHNALWDAKVIQMCHDRLVPYGSMQ